MTRPGTFPKSSFPDSPRSVLVTSKAPRLANSKYRDCRANDVICMLLFERPRFHHRAAGLNHNDFQVQNCSELADLARDMPHSYRAVVRWAACIPRFNELA